MGSILRNYMSRTEHTRDIVGDTKMSFTDFDHLGWLKCDGRALPIANYMSLYKVIGTTFGGSGSNFKLPDMRGRVAAAAGLGDGLDEGGRPLTLRTRGQYIGEEKHKLTIGELAAHNHGVAEGGQGPNNNLTGEGGRHNHGGTTSGLVPVNGINAIGNYLEKIDTGFTGEASANGGNDAGGTHDHYIPFEPVHTHVLNGAGNDIPHNNMQPTLILGNMFIYCNKVYEGAGHLSAGTDII